MTVLPKSAWNTVVAVTALAVSTTCAMAAGAHSDAQGWSGPGWYISSSEVPAFKLHATPAYILFEGPHERRNDCIAVYDRLYSPIGICRLLDAKPGSLPG